MKALSVILFILYMFSLNKAMAGVPAVQKDLDINQVSPVTPEAQFTSADVAKVIPTDIPADASDGEVQKRIMDAALRSALKSKAVKDTAVGKTAEELKEGLKADMTIESGEEEDKIEHKVRLQLDPIQTNAKLKYSGFFNATTTIESLSHVKIEITEKIFDDYQLNISHETEEGLSLVEVKWDW